jgi:hypothetical protein
MRRRFAAFIYQGFVPTVIVTDKLRSYGAALREIGFMDCMNNDCVSTIARRIRISRFGEDAMLNGNHKPTLRSWYQNKKE